MVKSSVEMQSLGERLAGNFVKGGIVTLRGDLGSGKTTFTQGFAKGLGIERRIISPTFVMVRKYEVRNMKQEGENPPLTPPREGKDKKKDSFIDFYHVDLYRTTSMQEIDGLGLREILADKSNVVVIEWAERLGELPKERLDLQFEYMRENVRKVMIGEH